MISVCMIVKNEERHLQNTLRSIEKHFDDIVILDTGSTDNSKTIAAEFTDKLYDFVWVSDFSLARNYAMQFTKYDWVLVIDADEEINTIDIKSLSLQIKNNPGNIGIIERLDHLDDYNEKSIVREKMSRLFNKNLFHYQGSIHEQIEPKAKDTIPKYFLTSIILNHVGYQQEILQQTHKLERNISMLQVALVGTPDDPYLHYQLGKSHYLNKDYQSAASSFIRALNLQRDFSLTYNENLIECYGYSLLNVGDYTQALDILKYEVYYQSADFMFLKALILMNNADLQGALNVFQQCTTLTSSRKEGVNSYKANYNIGVILECHNMKTEALDFYKKCGDYPPAIAGIARLA